MFGVLWQHKLHGAYSESHGNTGGYDRSLHALPGMGGFRDFFENGYYRAQKIIESQLHNVLLNAPGDTDVSEIPAVILIGKRYGEPIMCNWGYGTDWNAFEIGTGVGGAIYIGKIPPESTQERRQFEDLVEGDRSIGNTESRLIEAIRYAADWNGSKKINRNVATRRFSESFELHWHLDEPISNLPEPDLST